MADEIDRANDRAEHDLGRSIEEARKERKDAEATGACLWCRKDLSKGMRWCNAACRDDWQKDGIRHG